MHSAAQTAEASALLQRRAALEERALPLMLDAMWAANVLDIETTVRHVLCTLVVVMDLS